MEKILHHVLPLRWYDSAEWSLFLEYLLESKSILVVPRQDWLVHPALLLLSTLPTLSVSFFWSLG